MRDIADKPATRVYSNSERAPSVDSDNGPPSAKFSIGPPVANYAPIESDAVDGALHQQRAPITSTGTAPALAGARYLPMGMPAGDLPTPPSVRIVDPQASSTPDMTAPTDAVLASQQQQPIRARPLNQQPSRQQQQSLTQSAPLNKSQGLNNSVSVSCFPPVIPQSIFGRFASATVGRLASAVVAKTGPNQMILPDDRQPQIKWDPVAKKWTGAGVDADTVDVPPPTSANPSLASLTGASLPTTMNPAAQSTAALGQPPPTANAIGLSGARKSGGSRYFNQFNAGDSVPSSNTAAATNAKVAAVTPMMAVPTPGAFYGFIPQMPDNADGNDGGDQYGGGDPFSVGVALVRTQPPLKAPRPSDSNASDEKSTAKQQQPVY